MTTAPYPQVTNELLSAYIDEAVTEEERRLIEQAVAADPDVAWRLESLRATVRLLRELPALSLPRSFVLTPEQVAGAAGAQAFGAPAAEAAVGTYGAPVRRPVAEEAAGGFWQDLRRGWGRFWQGGSPALRNAMAASFAVLVVLLLAPRFVANTAFVALSTVETATAPQTQTSVTSGSATQKAAVSQLPTAAASTPASTAAAKQSAPAGAGEAGPPATAGTSTTASAAAPATQAATSEPAVAKTAASEQAENTQALTVSGAIARDASVPGGGASPGLAASAPPAAPGPAAMAAPSGRSILDDASAQAGGMAPAPAAGGGLTGAYASEPTASAAAPATELLADVDTQESPATPAATVAVAPTAPPAGAATAPDAVAEAAPAPVAHATAATSVVTAVAAGHAAVAAVAGGSGSAAPAPQVRQSTAGAQGRGFPAWLGLALQTAAVLAAVATLVFAILWWRSRRPVPGA